MYWLWIFGLWFPWGSFIRNHSPTEWLTLSLFLSFPIVLHFYSPSIFYIFDIIFYIFLFCVYFNWHAVVHGVTRSQIWLSDWTTTVTDPVDLRLEYFSKNPKTAHNFYIALRKCPSFCSPTFKCFIPYMYYPHYHQRDFLHFLSRDQ